MPVFTYPTAPRPTAYAVSEPSDDDAFDAAFDQAMTGEEPPVETPPAEDPPAEDPPAEDPPAEDPPAEDPPAEDPPAEDPPVEPAPAEDPPVEPAPITPKTYSEAEIAAAAAALKAAAPAPAEAPAPVVAPDPVVDDESTELPETQKTLTDYIPEAKRALVENYRKEWSEVSEAEEVIREAQLHMMTDKIYSDLKSALAPVFETNQRLQVDAHLNIIRGTHADLDTIRDELREWTDQQPEFVRPAYQQVLSQGSPQQVIELINQFKASQSPTGAVPAVPASSASKPQPARKPPSAAAKKAMAAAPSPRRAEIPGSSNPNDFDAAFEDAIGGIGTS